MAQVEVSEMTETQNRGYRGYHVSQDDDLFVDADDSNGEENESEVNGAGGKKEVKSKRKRNRKKKSNAVAKTTNGKVNGDASASDKENGYKDDDIKIEIE